jgi:UDP-N-acetylmuramyl pentapeptide phosphotransferase/UDP-N-acetylglucosamine-1-phosphate transferase
MGILVVIIVGLIASALGFLCWNYPLKQYDQV